jgi:aminoglycoside phosphotransferase (APT) family kinase protein
VTSASGARALVEPRAGVFDHGWLAAVLPADARRFRVADSGLAAVLSDAGAELVEERADVEIAPASELRGEADLAVVSFAARPHDSTHLAVRVGKRLVSAFEVRVKAFRARRSVRRRGYPRVDAVLWDVRQRFRLPGERSGDRELVEFLPQRALVLGRRSPPEPTLLAAALAAAGQAVGAPLQPEPPTIRAGLVATRTDKGLLRVAVGPARGQLAEQLKALQALRAAQVKGLVADRVPWPLAEGKSGLADWSLEQLLPGTRPAGGLSSELLAQCVDFLVALHESGGSGTARSLAEDADNVAALRPRAQAEALRDLGRRLESDLARVPRGFGHGDFFLGNLLTEGERLTGVVDWDAGGPGRLPLLDLLHLLHLAQYPLGDEDWGPAIVRHLLPWARSGGDDVVREYCERIGLDADPRLLEALAVAYWLDRVAYTLRTHRQRRAEPRWLARNVDLVVEAAPAYGSGGS